MEQQEAVDHGYLYLRVRVLSAVRHGKIVSAAGVAGLVSRAGAAAAVSVRR